MTNTPSNTGSSDISAELEDMLVDYWSESDFLKDSNNISKETVKKIIDLLGENAPKSLQEKISNWNGYGLNVVRNILRYNYTIDISKEAPDIARILAQTRVGLGNVLSKMKIKKTDELKDDAGDTYGSLDNIFSDPQSEAAKVIAYMFSKFGSQNKKKWRELITPLSKDDRDKIKALTDIRTIQHQMAADTSLHHLDTHIASMQAEKKVIDDYINARSTTLSPTGPTLPSPAPLSTGGVTININTAAPTAPAGTAGANNEMKEYFTRQRELNAEIQKLQSRKHSVENKLKMVEKKLNAAHLPHSLDPHTLAGDFDEHTLPHELSGNSESIGGIDHDLSDWIEDEEIQADLEKLKIRSKGGTDKLRAQMVLDMMLKSQAESSNVLASDAEQKEIAGQIRKLMFSKDKASHSSHEKEHTSHEEHKKGSRWTAPFRGLKKLFGGKGHGHDSHESDHGGDHGHGHPKGKWYTAPFRGAKYIVWDKFLNRDI